MKLKLYNTIDGIVFLPACEESERISKSWQLTKCYIKFLIEKMGYKIEIIKHEEE